jgi:hypothetical protein
MTTLNLHSSPVERDQSTAGAEKTEAITTSTGSDARTTGTTEEAKDPMHFSEWWIEYQEKMKTAFQGNSLKLQLQGQS